MPIKPPELSRRDFLGTAAVGLVACARSSQSLVRGEESQQDDALLYVGTYTEGGRSDGIYLLRLDRRSGKLRRAGSVNAGANPSFLAIHPNGRVLVVTHGGSVRRIQEVVHGEAAGVLANCEVLRLPYQLLH